jgi:hypothetical protein
VLAEELREADEALLEEEELRVVHLEVEALAEAGLVALVEELPAVVGEEAASPAAEVLPEEAASVHVEEGGGATERLRMDRLYQKHLQGVQVVILWRKPGDNERYQRMGGVLGVMFRDSKLSNS